MAFDDVAVDLGGVAGGHLVGDAPKEAGPYLLDPGVLLACRCNGNLKFVGMVSHVPQAPLQGLFVPVPALAEQDRIVTKFFELLGAIAPRTFYPG